MPKKKIQKKQFTAAQVEAIHTCIAVINVMGMVVENISPIGDEFKTEATIAVSDFMSSLYEDLARLKTRLYEEWTRFQSTSP